MSTIKISVSDRLTLEKGDKLTFMLTNIQPIIDGVIKTEVDSVKFSPYKVTLHDTEFLWDELKSMLELHFTKEKLESMIVAYCVTKPLE